MPPEPAAPASFPAPPLSSTYRLSGVLFVRALGVVYLIAFASLGVQVAGLAGSGGILPAGVFLEAARAQLGPERYWQIPTLFWWTGADDALLRAACWAGAAIGAAVALGFASRIGLALAWPLYLSLVAACRTFLNFQWDMLLLEAGFLALFVAPGGLWRRLAGAPDPPRWGMFLVRYLLFRLMFSSGVVKLASGDATWWKLQALDVHYFTQPIPTWTAWYVHQLPHAMQAASTAIMFGIELGAPWLIFAPRRLRLAGFAALAALQILIAATGNYAFFNLLTLALCLPLVDDAAWPAALRRRLGPDAGAPRAADEPNAGPAQPAEAIAVATARAWPGRVRRIAVAALLTLLVAVPTAEMTARWRLPLPWPSAVTALAEMMQPLRIANAYGLFAVMTTRRQEIVIEGSDDGQTWQAYGFRWKPGDVDRAPAFVAPHQPRLDWQMWFAALSEYRRQPWFQNLMVRLLQGSPEVLALLEHNPFPDRPPRQIRAVLYDYRFTDFATRRATGAWWTRQAVGLYAPAGALPR
jgi:hypothetical protein